MSPNIRLYVRKMFDRNVKILKGKSYVYGAVHHLDS